MQAESTLNFATTQQREATQPDGSFWVSANAGTGKTKVLVNRIISLIASGTTPSKILCITFTKAGAAEMISRINAESNRLLGLPVDELIKNIEGNCNILIDQSQVEKIRKTLISIIDNPDLIRIQTIHSFCGSVLKSFPLEAGVVPFFNTADDIQTTEIIDNAWKNFVNIIEALGKDDNPYFTSYSGLSSLYGFDTIKKTTLGLFEKRNEIGKIIQSKGNLADYLEYLKNSFDIDLSKDPENEFFERHKQDIEKLAYILKSGKSRVAARSEKLFAVIKKFSISRLKDIFFDEGKEKEILDKDIRKQFPQAEELVVALRNFINISSDKILTHKLFANTRDYLVLLAGFELQYEMEKSKDYFLDYDDLIEKTKNLLTNSEFASWVLYKMDGGVEHILVDEAQDTSPSQWDIIKAVSEEFFAGETKKKRTIFVVGDEKQSIFSFQGADLKVFSDIKTFFDLRIKQSSELHKILNKTPLTSSFRTLPVILELVDEILKNDNVKEATLSDITSHQASRVQPYGYIEIAELIPKGKTTRSNEPIKWCLPEEYEESDESKKKSVLAEKIVGKIDSIINQPHILPKTKSQAKAGDIIILLRKRDAELINLITEKLNKRSIATSGLDRLEITKNLAVMDILSCAKFILQKHDDYNLACLLKSPLIGLSEDDLFELCHYRKERSLYDFLLEHRGKYNDAINTLNDMLHIKHVAPSDLFFKLLDVYGFRKKLTASFGKSIDRIIDEFLVITEKYSINNLPTLQGFIKWFEKSGGEIKRDNNTGADEVRIMTIHASKGLEAPIIFLADTTSGTNEERSFAMNNNFILVAGSKNCSNAFYNGMLQDQRKKDDQEGLRLLYVALTRACDELYIYGLENSRKDSWYSLIKDSALKLPKARDDNGSIIISDDDYLKFISNEKVKSKALHQSATLPDFYFLDHLEVSTENNILPSLLSLKSYNNDEKAIAPNKTDLERGTIIHRLLEILPDFEERKRDSAFNIIISDFDIEDNEKLEELKAEVYSLLSSDELKFMFNNPSKTEVSISGYAEGNLVNGKIDRLVFEGDNIHLIDYKTHKNPTLIEAKLLEDYTPQMLLYYRLLKNIYPDKKILPKLLLTKTGKFLNYNFD